MSHLLRNMLGRLFPKPLDPYLEQLVHRTVDKIDPRLKSFSNFPHAYSQSVSAAYDYAKGLANSLPAYVELSPAQYANDPLLHSLFSDVRSINSMVSESRDIQEYCHAFGPPVGGEMYALMGMRRREKSEIGSEMDGDVIRQDVQHTVIYFESHTLGVPSASKEEFEKKLVEHFFDSIIDNFSNKIKQKQIKKKEMELERDTLIAHTRRSVQQDADQEKKLEELRTELESLSREYSLSNYPKLMKQCINGCNNILYMEHKNIPIDMRGVMRESSDRLGGVFEFCDLIGRDRRCWSLCPVHFSIDVFKSDLKCSTDKARWMEI